MPTPTSAELPDARALFPGVRQHAPAWCIPAGIDVILRYFGFSVPTQEDIVLEYYRRFGPDAYCDLAGRRICIIATSDADILRASAMCGFTRGDFGSFSDIAISLLGPDTDFEFYHPPDPKNFPGHMKNSIAAKHGFLMATTNPDGNFHIWAVVGYSDDLITGYDPDSGTIHSKTAREFQTNYDSLILRKKGGI